MDTPQQYPTMWTTGYLANGMKVSFTFPIRNEFEACKQALEITNKLLADGFTTNDPTMAALEAGEGREQVGYLVRRNQKNNSDNSVTPVIDVYPTPEATKLKFMSIYLDTADDVEAFEKAFGLKLASLPVLPGKKSIERGEQDFTQYVIKVVGNVSAVYKANPRYNPEETDLTKKKPKRLFVRWEVANASPAPQTPPQPSQPATPPAGKPEPARNARLQNEELTITRIVKTGEITGNSDPQKNGAKYDGWGKIVDGGVFDVRVWIFPEDVREIKEQGYEFHEGNDLNIHILMDTTDRSMTRIGGVLNKADQNSVNAIVDGNNGNFGDAPKWFSERLPEAWATLRPYLAKEIYKGNLVGMEKSLTFHAKATSNWKNMDAGQVIEYLMHHHDEKAAS